MDNDLSLAAPCEFAGCQHLCVSEAHGGAECLCAAGYVLQPDRKSCKGTVGSSIFLLLKKECECQKHLCVVCCRSFLPQTSLFLADDGKFGTPQFIYSIGTALCRFPGNLADMSLQVCCWQSMHFFSYTWEKRNLLRFDRTFHKLVVSFPHTFSSVAFVLRCVVTSRLPSFRNLLLRQTFWLLSNVFFHRTLVWTRSASWLTDERSLHSPSTCVTNSSTSQRTEQKPFPGFTWSKGKDQKLSLAELELSKVANMFSFVRFKYVGYGDTAFLKLGRGWAGLEKTNLKEKVCAMSLVGNGTKWN